MKALRIIRHSSQTLILLFVTLLTIPPGVMAQERAQDLFQQALRMERVSGDLEEAIRLYQQVVDTGDRALGARALIRMAESYEKLGQRGAQDAYARIIQEFGDQTEQVALARERLADLQGPDRTEVEQVPAAQVRRLLIPALEGCTAEGMRPSPDGTRIAYSCEDGGVVYVRDLESGEAKRVTNEGYHLGGVWSPDGMRLAVMDFNAGVNDPNAERSPFKIIDLESGTVETPAVLDGVWFSPRDWSPDGERLTGTLEVEENSSSSVVFSLRTGEFIELARGINQGMGHTRFSPDGRFVAFADYVDGNQDIYVMALATGERYRVTSDAEADAVPIRMVNGQPEGEPRHLSGGGGWQGTWIARGYYYAKANKVSRAYRIGVDPGTAQPIGSPEVFAEVDGRDLFAWSPDGQRIAASDHLGDWGMIYLADGRSVTAFPVGDEIMTTKLWWSGDGREILFTSKTLAARDKRSTVYALDPSDGSMREIFPRLDSIGHVHVSPDGQKMVFLRETAGNRRAEIVVSDLGKTQGRVLASGSHPEGDLSGIFGQPLFSPDGSQVLFLRQDWSQPEVLSASLWVVPSDGSEPPRLVARAPLIQDPIWHPAGRFIAFKELDFAEPPGTSTVSVVSLETGAVHQVLPRSSAKVGLRLNDWSQSEGHWEIWVVENLLGEGGRRP